MRLDKYICETAGSTRSEVKKIIRSGQVAVNEQVIKDAGYALDPDKDTVSLNGKKLNYAKFHYIMLNKPAGCVTATRDDKFTTVMDYIPAELRKDMSPVGRLDRDTEGLLLITDDGQLNHNLLSPKKHVDKTYFVRLDGPATSEDVDAFIAGIDIGEKKVCKPAKLVIDANNVCEACITISEGKFHQIKRMFHVRGKEVVYLKRLSMGSLVLDESLELGNWRYLTKEEIENLKR